MGIDSKERYHWTDSEIVLHWIRKCPSDAKLFVGNRISIVQEHSNVQSWRHVASKDNPADLLSRSVTPGELINVEIWWIGPTFLRGRENGWPVWTKCKLSAEQSGQVCEEIRKTPIFEAPVLVLTIIGQSGEDPVRKLLELTDLLANRSRMSKTLRITAYVQRFVRIFCAKWGRRSEAVALMLTRKRRAEEDEKAAEFAKRNQATVPEMMSDSSRVVQEQHEVVQSSPEVEKPLDVKMLIKMVPSVTHEEYAAALLFWINDANIHRSIKIC